MNERIALITGGTRGIGAAISEILKNAHYQVVATYQGNEHSAKLVEKRLGIRVYKWNVGDYNACLNGVRRIEEEIGPVDILINNAGITQDSMFHKMDLEQWQDVLTTNLTSCFNMCRAVIDGMRARNFGRIINISSINGQKGQLGQVNYSAAKAGVNGFSKALALEVAKKGITVNTIAPGYIETDMMNTLSEEILNKIVSNIPVGRLGQAKEIAQAVLFLANDNAGFITGSTFSINGGQHMI